MNGPITSPWGKLRRSDDGALAEWHPLVDHCADVAACCEVLLGRPAIRGRLARLARVSELSAGILARLCVLAALHDLGKVNRGFQAKADRNPRRVAGHVGPALALLTSERYVATERLEDILHPLSGWGAAVGDLLKAAISHHGGPLHDPGAVDAWVWDGSPSPLDTVADLMDHARHWFPAAFSTEVEPLPEAAEFGHAFAGLVMLADWIGSDTSLFRYSEPGDADRIVSSRTWAASALRDIGLDTGRFRSVVPSGPVGFDRVSTYSPRAAQQVLGDIEPVASGSTVVLESETGSGKTEAALWWFLRLFEAGLVDGLYFALPTRTAATQIHRRVVEAARRAFGPQHPPVVLAVPGYLRVDDKEGKRLAPFEVQWPDDDRARHTHRTWAAENPKRYFAGPIVVGTVDQALMSALAVGHAHLRATALLRHLLVVDEVHASDAYMTRLLQEVLSHQRAAGGHTLLMSATLGSTARDRLLGVRSSSTLEAASALAYPLVSISGASTPTFVAVDQPESDKVVHVEAAASMGDAPRVARMALDAAKAGGRVLVLRNTVRGCLDVQSALETLASADGADGLLFRCASVVAPHHARFARDDREQLDIAIERALGKGSAAPVVVVATQTVQQSLDLDADLLLTDLAPLDVLLQRIGRLHRDRQRTRRTGFEKPRAIILVPEERDLGRLIGSKGTASGRHGLGRVYEDLRILEATWREIERRGEWRIPSMNRALVEATTHPDALGAITREGGEIWKRHEGALIGQGIAQRRQAALNVFDWATPYPEQHPPTKDERIQTRLGAGDRLANFEPPQIGPFGNPVATLTIPAYLAAGVPDEETPQVLEYAADLLRFSYGNRTYLYDRWGLRPEPTRGG